jgi:hypothetical protein
MIFGPPPQSRLREAIRIRTVSIASSASITDEEFASALSSLPTTPEVADRLSSYFDSHPYDLHLSHLQSLFPFYDPDSGTSPSSLWTVSSILLSILSYPSQHIAVPLFFVDNGFHFLLASLFPDFGSLAMLTALNPHSEEVRTFLLERDFLGKAESLLDPECPLVVPAIHFVGSFAWGTRSPYCACAPAVLKLIPLIYGYTETDLCIAGLSALTRFVAGMLEIFDLVITRSDFLGFLGSLGPECPRTRGAVCCLLEAAFAKPERTLQRQLDLPQKEAMLRFLAGSLATDNSQLIRAATRIAPLLIDEGTAALCHHLAFGQRMVELLRVELDFTAHRAILQSLLTLITYGSAEEAAALISCGFFAAVSERIDRMKDSLVDEIVTAVTVVVRFGNDDWNRAIAENEEMVNALAEFCDLLDDVCAKLIDGER